MTSCCFTLKNVGPVKPITVSEFVAGTTTYACRWTAISLRVRGDETPEIERLRLK